MPGFSSTPFGPQNFDAQHSFITDLARRSYDITRRVAELNLRLSQQLLLDASQATRQAFSASDPFQAIAASIQAAQPAFDHMRTYQLELASVFRGLRAGGPERATQAQAGALAGGDPLTNASRAEQAAGAAGYSRPH